MSAPRKIYISRLLFLAPPTKPELDEDIKYIRADIAEAMLAVLKELEETAAYWGEYDVPIGIVDRIRAAIAGAEAVGD